MYQILMVEDSLDSQELVTMLLKSIAQVAVAPSVEQAFKLFSKQRFDLILMDVMLEDGDGFSLTKKIRETPEGRNIPIVFLTSKSDIGDKKTGFKLGAEDYIVKPFDHDEFVLRLESRLEKGHRNKGSDVMESGNLRLEVPLQNAILIQESKNLGLTPIQFKIIFFLMRNEGEVVAREKLISEIWGKDVHVGRSIDTHINALRKKLGVHANYIESVYGAGYIFNSKV